MMNEKKMISRRVGISIGILVLLIWLLFGQVYFGLPNAMTLEHASNGILTFEDMQRWAVFLIMIGGVIAFYYVPTKSCSDSVKAEIETMYQKEKENTLNEQEKQDLAYHKFYDSMNQLGHLVLKIGFLLLIIGTVFQIV